MNMNKFANKRANTDMSAEMMMRTPQVLHSPYTSSVYDVYLDGEIGEPSQYREIYHALINAGHQDLVLLHINSNGGRIDTGLQIINHIKNCKAKVVGVMHNNAASMASGIMLACSDWEITPFSTAMIHSCSYSIGGKQSDIRAGVEFTTKFNENFIRATYEGFLTEEEFDRVLKGDDVYLDAEQLEEKLTAFKQYREDKENEEFLEEEEETMEAPIEIEVKPVRKPRAKKEKPAE
jgi:ATP-dependent protease ClpP protease subunit